MYVKGTYAVWIGYDRKLPKMKVTLMRMCNTHNSICLWCYLGLIDLNASAVISNNPKHESNISSNMSSLRVIAICLPLKINFNLCPGILFKVIVVWLQYFRYVSLLEHFWSTWHWPLTQGHHLPSWSDYWHVKPLGSYFAEMSSMVCSSKRIQRQADRQTY